MTLSWVGTGRCLSSMDFSEGDYEALRVKVLDAARRMKADGWWLSAQEHPGRERSMRKGLVREMLGSLVRVPQPIHAFYAEIMRRKKDDHHASHSNVVNQLFHIISSSAFLVCYGLVFWDLTTAMWAGLAALFLRQIGHAVLEPPCHDKEAVLLGYNTRNKTLILGTYLLIPAVYVAQASAWTAEALWPLVGPVAQALFLWTALRGRGARGVSHRRQGRVARAGLVRQAHHRSRHGPAGLLASLSRGAEGDVRVTRAKRRIAMSGCSRLPRRP